MNGVIIILTWKLVTTLGAVLEMLLLYMYARMVQRDDGIYDQIVVYNYPW
jgi:hypothetical protein